MVLHAEMLMRKIEICFSTISIIIYRIVAHTIVGHSFKSFGIFFFSPIQKSIRPPYVLHITHYTFCVPIEMR